MSDTSAPTAVSWEGQTLRARFLDNPRVAATDQKVAAVVMRDANGGSDGAATAERGSGEPTLPPPCRAEQIVWSAVRSEIAQMLSQSDLISEVFRRFSPERGNVDILANDLASITSGGELGRTGRSPRAPARHDLVALQFAWSRIPSRLALASVMAHEYAHVRDALERGFTLAESATALEFPDYLSLRWHSEFDAHVFQLTVMRQVAEAVPRLQACLPGLIAANPVLAALAGGDRAGARLALVNTYDLLHMQRNFREGRAAGGLSDSERQAVHEYVAAPVIQSELAAWRPLLPAD